MMIAHSPKTAWTLRLDDDGIAWLTFDRPGHRVNTFGRETLDELEARLDEVAADDSIHTVVVVSGKPDSFIAGADLEEFSLIHDEDQARALSERGQEVFAKLASLSQTTIAVIHGSCLGGGLEMALACDYRLVTDHKSTSLGLPEVNLGIIPGWGGTQRLPKLIGLAPALKIILTGKPVSARKAFRMGLADGIVAEAFLADHTRRFVERVRTDAGRRDVLARRRRVRSRVQRAIEATPPGRALMLRAARKNVLRKTHGHYPAPLEAIRVIGETFVHPSMRTEADALARLACTPISRNLVRIFRSSQQLKKRSAKDGSGVRVGSAAVVGAGAMGGGIAWALSNAGIPVRLKDISWEAVAQGTSSAAAMFAGKVKRRRMTAGEMNLAMHRISGTVEYTGFGHVDAVIEAVVENMDIKRQVLREIERCVPRHALIMSNTSSLSIDEMAAALRHPDRFLGLHFFNPVNLMQLVEVVPGEKTSHEAVVSACELVRSMGKIPIVVGSCAGFLVNRILLPYIIESAAMFEEGVPVERIDRVLVEFGMPMGALALADEVGLDVGYKVAKVLEHAYGPRMRVPDGFGRIVQDGTTIGKKSGRGFYIYDSGNKRPNDEARALASNGHTAGGSNGEAIPDADVLDRAILVMVNEAARCLDEGIADDADALDLAMVMGTGFAPFRGGVMRYAQERGLREVVERLGELASKYGERFEPAPLLVQLAEGGPGFDGSVANGKGGERS
ncbi:MAG: enoyl-CoA hydratase/isomerase family protein [Planctomycetes bacterium]|nr:enoyl-CoA hydratase/isomerase family protein [Planctomycetota bacterium]